jgi:REP element-mobilizing transposase RayT
MADVKTYRSQTVRLSTRNYDEGGPYFVTICTIEKRMLLGRVRDCELVPSEIGRIAIDFWREIPQHHTGLELDEFVVMPNHMHGILWLPRKDIRNNPKRVNQFRSPAKGTLGHVIRTYKAAVTYFAKKSNFEFGWQGLYWDHAIRSNSALMSIREYIKQNPLNWGWDSFNPSVAHLYTPDRK